MKSTPSRTPSAARTWRSAWSGWRPSRTRPRSAIGLSATQRPLSAVAAFLGGREGGGNGDGPSPARPVTIVDAGIRKPLELQVVVPVEDMSRLGEAIPLDEAPGGAAAGPEARTSIWPQVYPRLLELIRSHRSTIVFTNSRRLAERLALKLNELAGEDIVKAHHGSLAREQRLIIEEALKDGRLPALVATSSLELGIDMGAVDLVIQVESPLSVARGLQRVGRAGHNVGDSSKGVIFPKYRGDLLECAVVTKLMHEGAIEPTVIRATRWTSSPSSWWPPPRSAPGPRTSCSRWRAARRTSRSWAATRSRRSWGCSPGSTPRTSSRSSSPA